MAKKHSIPDTSTVSELLVKEWLDKYPQDTVSSLHSKAQSLTYTINTTQEEFKKLSLAKSRLDDLTDTLPPIITSLDAAIKRRQDFIATYGDLGASLKIPYETMDATLRSYTENLADYAVQVTERYFANLSEVEHTIAYLTSIRDFYQDLATIPTVIRMNFLKTPEDRRKPIIRELYRLFKSLADNHLFFGLAPHIENKLIPYKIDEQEFKSLCEIRKQAKLFAEIIKKAR